MAELYQPLIEPSARKSEEENVFLRVISTYAPYEFSFIPLEEHPDCYFWMWGIFTSLPQMDALLQEELRLDGWEQRTDAVGDMLLWLQNQGSQVLFVEEADGTRSEWVRRSDLSHAQQYPVALSYRSEQRTIPQSIPADLVIGSCALVAQGASCHVYMLEQLGEDARQYCAQIQEGLQLFLTDDHPLSTEQQREQHRRAFWEQTHKAAQDLAVCYWEFHRAQQHATSVEQGSYRTLPAIPHIISRGALIAATPLPVEAVIMAYSNAQHGASQWETKGLLPTFAYRRDEGVTQLQIRPSDEETVLDPSTIETLWQQVRQLSDIDGDVLLTLIAQAIASPEKANVWITGKAILDYRGIQPMMKREANGKKRRAGHRQEDLEEVAACIGRMSSTWISVEQWIEDDEMMLPISLKRRKKQQKQDGRYLYTRESRLVIITEIIRQHELRQDGKGEDSGKLSLAVAWRYQLGSWLDPFLKGANRQVAWLLQQVLSYDPYHQIWEKRLARYFTFHMRIASAMRSVTLCREIGILIGELSLPINRRDPEKTRQRFEKAMDRLVQDHIIATWSYLPEEFKLPLRKWLETWLSFRIIVEVVLPTPADLSVPENFVKEE